LHSAERARMVGKDGSWHHSADRQGTKACVERVEGDDCLGGRRPSVGEGASPYHQPRRHVGGRRGCAGSGREQMPGSKCDNIKSSVLWQRTLHEP